MHRLLKKPVIVADGHPRRRFDRLHRHEFGGVALELVDAVDHAGAMDGFGGVGRRRRRGPLLQQVVDVRAGDGARLRGRLRIDGQREHRFEAAELDRTHDFGGHGVAAFDALGRGF